MIGLRFKRYGFQQFDRAIIALVPESTNIGSSMLVLSLLPFFLSFAFLPFFSLLYKYKREKKGSTIKELNQGLNCNALLTCKQIFINVKWVLSQNYWVIEGEASGVIHHYYISLSI